MTIICGLLVLALVAVVVVLLRHNAEQAARADKRERELLNRIQHPSIVPSEPTAPLVLPDLEPDESYMVGRVYDD